MLAARHIQNNHSAKCNSNLDAKIVMRMLDPPHTMLEFFMDGRQLVSGVYFYFESPFF